MKIYKVVSVVELDDYDNERIVRMTKVRKNSKDIDTDMLDREGMQEIGEIDRYDIGKYKLRAKDFDLDREHIYITYFNLSDEWLNKGMSGAYYTDYGNLREMAIKKLKMKEYINKL